ncbi:ras-related protein Rab-24 isoform X2 [Odontomachus brunneus]|uniref:ras-related protein Rab-24 isoform X2 n=1 Tax=Odontomachus brunneus TaxID=486640 RepID=UPI0013F221FC|nr:ras-related protein Rab-24 isoform X2 [Odontomachus brunneus]
MSNSNDKFKIPNELRIVLLGKSGVGKTSLITRFFNELNDNETSINSRAKTGAICTKRKIQIDEVLFDVEIWDTAGEQKYDSMAPMYCSGRAAVIICYDITDSLSFIKAKEWLLQFRIHSCNIYICATKKDLCNEHKTPNPPLNSAQEYAESVMTKFFVTSSYTGENLSCSTQL